MLVSNPIYYLSCFPKQEIPFFRRWQFHSVELLFIAALSGASLCAGISTRKAQRLSQREEQTPRTSNLSKGLESLLFG
ncbi:hypothetical protein CLOSTMETH_00221 [[Clostridium] methylpentosum DSM 5476]|uniref:Uncharacterized protein n=1 Tax=[Clostridium] methylpentosum DSM 5476 TaxID=537013 RepID=C0E8S6_9FIRM|nr:hypothetical protein CLOSTMETH_00221 [[Clostridium] methylpentosum DSM 5476]